MEMLIKFLIFLGIYILFALILKGKGIPFLFYIIVPFFLIGILGTLFCALAMVIVEEIEDRFSS